MRPTLLVLLAACGSPRAPVPEPAIAPGSPAATPLDAVPPDAPEPAIATAIDAASPDAEPFDCAEPCTDYGVCWERVNKGRDFAGGRVCDFNCTHMSPSDRTDWIARIAAAVKDPRKCRRLVED